MRIVRKQKPTKSRDFMQSSPVDVLNMLRKVFLFSMFINRANSSMLGSDRKISIKAALSRIVDELRVAFRYSRHDKLCINSLPHASMRLAAGSYVVRVLGKSFRKRKSKFRVQTQFSLFNFAKCLS